MHTFAVFPEVDRSIFGELLPLGKFTESGKLQSYGIEVDDGNKKPVEWEP